MNSFSESLKQINLNKLVEFSNSTTKKQVQNILNEKRSYPSLEIFAKLLSPAATNYLEIMAQKSQQITRQRFGNIIQLYTPMYISNECTNTCTYCGFTRENKIPRKSLNSQECQTEVKYLYNRGFRDLLIVSGEHQKIVTPQYIGKISTICKDYFHNIAIETAPFSQEEYKYLISKDIQGLTIYQETYDKETYSQVHLYGKKKNYNWRIDAPERGAKAGMRKINMGVLLGLSKNWKYDSIMTAIHLQYMIKKYWTIQYGVSIPRICQSETNFKAAIDISDSQLAQIIFSYRIAFPNLNINLSTRESAKLRDGLFDLGITHISAESATNPGGYSQPNNSLKQFDINDERSLEIIITTLKKKNLQPVQKNWHIGLIGSNK